jgi:hypothetical protein
MKVLILLSLMLFSFASLASECASNISELKALVGNNGIALNWHENTKSNPLKLKLSDGGNLLRLKLTNPDGDWADVTGVVCKKSQDSYVAQVSNIVWGPAAPGMVKGSKIKTLNIKLPYQSVLKVSVMFFSFEFSPI